MSAKIQVMAAAQWSRHRANHPKSNTGMFNQAKPNRQHTSNAFHRAYLTDVHISQGSKPAITVVY